MRRQLELLNSNSFLTYLFCAFRLSVFPLYDKNEEVSCEENREVRKIPEVSDRLLLVE